jgi:RimJ/RimL family protein N-acetyltransferase
MANPAIAYFVARLKENDAALGLITFIKRDYLNHHDIGFAFLPAYSKQGYAYEAACAFLKSLTNPPHAQIQAVTISHNVSSIALLKKLGLQFEKEIEMNNESLQVYSATTDKLLLL